MFCNQCGASLPDGSAFCNACGAKLITFDNGYAQQSYEQGNIQQSYDRQPYTQPQYATHQEPQTYAQSQGYGGNKKPSHKKKPASGKKKGLIIGSSIAAVLIVAAVIVLVVVKPFKSKNEEEKYKTPTPFDKISYDMTRSEGISRYGTPDSADGHSQFCEDIYNYEFMNVVGELRIYYVTNPDDPYNVDSSTFSYADWRFDDDMESSGGYDTFLTLKSNLSEIEEIMQEFVGADGVWYTDTDIEYLEIAWINSEALKLRKDYASNVCLEVEEDDNCIDIYFEYIPRDRYEDIQKHLDGVNNTEYDDYDTPATTEDMVEEITEQETTEQVTTEEETTDIGNSSEGMEAVTADEFTKLPFLYLEKGSDPSGVHNYLGEPHHTEYSNDWLYEFYEYEYSGIDGTLYVVYDSYNKINMGFWININVNDATVDSRFDENVSSGKFNSDFSIFEESLKTSIGLERDTFNESESEINIMYGNEYTDKTIWIWYRKNNEELEIGYFYFG